MRRPQARVTGGWDIATGKSDESSSALHMRMVMGRRIFTALVITFVLAAAALVVSPAAKAGADTTFATGQVFASVGFSTVNVYDPVSGNQITSLVDSTNEPFTAGSAFDSNGDFYVTDDLNGDISEFSPTGQPLPTFATGLTNPLSLVFDSSGNLYVGQQGTPYIAEFTASGQRLPDIGPVETGESGDDWIDLSSDQCTFYYTTETDQIYRFNKCTNSQLPNFNASSLPGPNAYELRILENGDVLVADSTAVYLLDPNGNIIQTYACSSMPGCADELFAVEVDPSGTSFWTGDNFSGNIYQINMSTGQVMQTINAETAYLYGLSVKGEINVATSSTVVSATPTTLTLSPVSGDFSSPTPVSAVLTNSATDTPISGEQVTFTLNGAETCTATTDSTGTATCIITPTEPSQSYTLTASFSGDTTMSTPIGSTSSSSNFTVTPDTTTLDYTGPTTAVNGSPVTLSGTLTTDNPSTGTPLGNQVVTFTLGSQTCSGTTDLDGNVSCTITPVAQTVSNDTVTVSYGGSSYETPASTSAAVLVTEPTTLAVNSATGDYSDATTVSGVLTDSLSGQPIPGEQVTLTLNSTESCTATTDATGTASCSITPSEPAATYPLTGSFAGDTSQPLELMPSTGSSSFVVTLEETALTYTGPTTATNGQPLTVSGVLTSDELGGPPIVGRTVSFQLGSGASAQTCAAVTSATGTASCTISSVNQPQGPIPVTDTFAGDAYYQMASAASTVNLPEGTTLTISPTSGTYEGSTSVSGTLTNTYTGQPVPNEPVTLTVNGTQSCTATTNAQGVATCNITPNEPAGTYTLSGSFPGDTSSMPQLLSTSSSTTFTVTKAPTTVVYTGPTTLTNGQSVTLSGVVTSSEPTAGTPVAGQTVTFTIGSGSSAQSCTATSNASGQVSCTIAKVNQKCSLLTVPIAVTYGGNTYYLSSTTSGSLTLGTPTNLSVSAVSGPTGQAATLSGTLTNALTGAAISGETITLTLNGTQSCSAITNSQGVASCKVTPNESVGTYTITGSFGGGTTGSGQMCGCGPTAVFASTGSNNFVVTKAPTTVTYTGATSADQGQSLTLSSQLTSNGVALSGQPVVMTLGSGSSAQSCTATTNSSGDASCTVSVSQVQGSVTVTVTYAGNSYYQSSSTSAIVKISTCGGSGGGSGGGGSGGSGGQSGGQGGGSTEPGGGSGGGNSRPPCGGGGN